MTKILTIVGTRPEIIKMSCVIKELDRNFNHILVHTGQNYDYELNEIFFRDLEVRKPDFFLDVADKSLAKTIANIIFKSDEIIKKIKPDALLIYGDTNSCLSAISAKRRKIPIFHFEAGNRSFDQRVPEEINRKIVDHISDINFVLTEHSRQYLIQEGIKSQTIFKTGSHMYEVIKKFKTKINNAKILNNLKIKKNNYFLFSIHREENVDNLKKLKQIIETIKYLYLKYKIPIIISTHPRTRNRLEKISNKIKNKNIKFLKPFGFFDYIKLQTNAKCVISDSGTITEESSILKFPAINLRENHERPEGMDVGAVILSGISKDRVLESVKMTIDHFKLKPESFNDVNDYKNLNLSFQVSRVLVSYIDYVNREIWKKN